MLRYWNIMQIEIIVFISKNRFSMESCLSILRLSLDSWCRNMFKSGLKFWFRVSIGLTRKTRQTLIGNFHSWSKKMWIFCKRHQTWVNYILLESIFFIMSTNSRSLPQNKAPFGWDSLANLLIVWKYVPTIQAFSLEIEGTILKKELRWTYWEPSWRRSWDEHIGTKHHHQNWPEDDIWTRVFSFTPPSSNRSTWVVTQLVVVVSPPSKHAQPRRVFWSFDDDDRPRPWGWVKRERKIGREGERKKKKKKNKKKSRGVGHVSSQDWGLF